MLEEDIWNTCIPCSDFFRAFVLKDANEFPLVFATCAPHISYLYDRTYLSVCIVEMYTVVSIQ